MFRKSSSRAGSIHASCAALRHAGLSVADLSATVEPGKIFCSILLKRATPTE
jgi:hypothetical protein